MNYFNYSVLKGKNSITLSKKNGKIFATSKMFDPDTGTAMPDRMEEIPVDFFTRRKTELTKELAELELLLNDISQLS